MKKAYVNWSTGKDAAFALYKIQQENEFSPQKLLTVINSETESVAMHELPEILLRQQAESLGMELQSIFLPENAPQETYRAVMLDAVNKLQDENFTHSIFGDILLEDLRQYREKQLEKTGIKAVFPLWKKNTTVLMQEFLKAGFRAVVVCVNAKVLPASFCGRELDEKFLADLPKDVDPCGENGEFHTFVYHGPNFKFPISFKKGELHTKNWESNKNQAWDSRFYYCDLLPVLNH